MGAEGKSVERVLFPWKIWVMFKQKKRREGEINKI
jgi:hypothetical protein